MLKRLVKTSGLVVIFLLSSCDNSGHGSITFPAQIAEIQGFPGTEVDALNTRVDSLLKKVGTTFLVPAGEAGSGSVVRIRMVEELESTSSEQSAAEVDFTTVAAPLAGLRSLGNQTNRIAGRATRTANECIVEIARFVVEYRDELFQPVLWHEIAHCAGITHDPQTYQIMSAVTYPLSYYNDSKISHFIEILTAAIH